jgi:RNA polymerase sigma factor for flagellar operon FliA
MGEGVETAQLWARTRVGDGAARCSLIERYASLATVIARSMPLPLGVPADRDDLESVGVIGLIDAVDRFDPGRGIPFEAYAVVRIRGAILDELRRMDERSRDERRQLRLAQRNGGNGHDGERPHERAGQTNGKRAARAYAGNGHATDGGRTALTVSLDRLLEEGRDWAGDDVVEARLEAEDLSSRVRAGLCSLTPRQRELLARYYGDELTLRQVGAKMGISEARACQLHVRAIRDLRREVLAEAPEEARPAAFA